MRACVFDAASPSGVKMIDTALPKRGRSSALIKVHACGINPVDAKYIVGDKFPESWMGWAAKKATGHTPGFDFSGVVVDVRQPNSLGLKAGDEVFGFACNPAHFLRPMSHLRGSFAEYVAAPLDQIARKATMLSHAEAAALPLVGTTALQAMQQHGVREGQRVLIIGASGGVGHIAIQVAKHMGATVTAVCSSRNASFVVDTCGADSVLTYDEDDVYEKIAADAAAAGAPYDFVLDCVSSADARDQAASYAARVRSMSPPVVAAGRDADRHCYVVLGGATRHWAIALLKRFLGLNCFEAGFELFWIQMPGSRTVLQQLSAFAGAAHEGHPRPLKPKIDTKAEFSEAAARRAFDALRGRRTAGKIVMEVVPPGAGGAGGNV